MTDNKETKIRQTTFIIERNRTPNATGETTYTVRPNPETTSYEELSRYVSYGRTPTDALTNMLNRVERDIDTLRAFRYHVADKISSQVDTSNRTK